jgi:multiple sugar transport system permease protein
VPIVVAGIFLLPLAWTVSASLRAPGLPPPRTIEWIPDPIAWSNYARIFEMLPFGGYVVNSLVVVALAVPLTLATASAAGFAMSQLSRPAQRWLLVGSLALLMIPLTALWLTRYLLYSLVGLTDTLLALILPAVMGSSPLFVLLFYWAFRRVPGEVFDAARLDGAGAFSIWRRIGLPLVAPTIVAVGILAFLLYWSDFINPLLYLKSQDLYTLPLGLRQLQQLDRSNWSLLMAGSVVLAAPAVVLFLVLQRSFLRDSPLTGTEVN